MDFLTRGNSIGSRIEHLRKKENLTQAALAKKIGVKREQIVQWESNTREIKAKYIISLANFFNVSCDEILRGQKPENIEIGKRADVEDRTIEAVEELQNGYSPMGNYFLNSLFKITTSELGINREHPYMLDAILYDLQSVFYDYLWARYDATTLSVERNNEKKKLRKKTNKLTPVIIDNKRVYDMYSFCTDEKGYLNYRLRELCDDFCLLMKELCDRAHPIFDKTLQRERGKLHDEEGNRVYSPKDNPKNNERMLLDIEEWLCNL